MIGLNLRKSISAGAILLLWGAASNATFARGSKDTVYTATAYSTAGTTASGQETHKHIVAADPALLPLGSRIRIRWAGRYNGEYVVADTGSKIEGKRLDIFIPHLASAKKFGRRPVKVRVIKLGEGTAADTKQSNQEVKAAVKKDVVNEIQNGAATKEDLAAAGVKTVLASEDPTKTTAPATPVTAPSSAADTTGASR